MNDSNQVTFTQPTSYGDLYAELAKLDGVDSQAQFQQQSQVQHKPQCKFNPCTYVCKLSHFLGPDGKEKCGVHPGKCYGLAGINKEAALAHCDKYSHEQLVPMQVPMQAPIRVPTPEATPQQSWGNMIEPESRNVLAEKPHRRDSPTRTPPKTCDNERFMFMLDDRMFVPMGKCGNPRSAGFVYCSECARMKEDFQKDMGRAVARKGHKGK